MFGIATTSDVYRLHATLENLRTQNSDIVHSLTDQITLVKKTGHTAEMHADVISNLSSTVKENIQSHEKFQQVARDLMWFNITIHAQSALFSTIKELEFALLRLIQQLEELINALHLASQGNLPVNFVNPTVLLGILKNVSLQLPGSHALIAGIRSENIHLYYELRFQYLPLLMILRWY